MRTNRRRWFTDALSPYELHRHGLKKIIIRTKTKFQHVLLADTFAFGRTLILDDEIQSAEADEFIYHEALVHPGMMLHPNPKDILILGGGEGATTREVLRHLSVRRVTLVDIDGDVVDFCKRYLPGWHQGSFAHPKTRLLIGDARKYVLETKEQFDIIISDLPTPNGRSPLELLYTSAFYRRMMGRLKPGGHLVVQSGSGSLFQLAFHKALHRTLKGLFKVVRPYYTFVPSFDVPWSFLIAAQNADPCSLSAEQIDKKLGTIRHTLRFYDGETHESLFHIPKHLRAQLKPK